MSKDKSENADAEKEPEKKKGGLLVTLIPFVVCSLVAVGGGWYIGGQMNPSAPMTAAETVKTDKQSKKDKSKDAHGKDDGHAADSDEGHASDDADATEVVPLSPILVALKSSQNTFLRLELAIITSSDIDLGSEDAKLRLSSEISAFVQTLTLSQISGPSGYLHFREDLNDRVRLFSEGAIKDVLIMSMVAE